MKSIMRVCWILLVLGACCLTSAFSVRAEGDPSAYGEMGEGPQVSIGEEIIISLDSFSVTDVTLEGVPRKQVVCQLIIHSGSGPFTCTFRLLKDGEAVYSTESGEMQFTYAGELLEEEGIYTVLATVSDSSGQSVSVGSNGYYKRSQEGNIQGEYMPRVLPVENLTATVGNIKTIRLGESEEIVSYKWQFSDDGGESWQEAGDGSHELQWLISEDMDGRLLRCFVYGVHKEVQLVDAMQLKLQYQITFSDASGEGPDYLPREGKQKGKDYVIPQAIPVREGYSFLGWTKEKGSQEVQYRPGDPYREDAHLTLYAVWEWALPGDINGDGQVNIFDIIRLLKKVTGEEAETFASTDVNGDGKENIFDVIRLLKKVTGEDVEVS